MIFDQRRPSNWLLISFDQWRGDWIHQSWLDLPHLKRLSCYGWDVRRCYTSSPQCIPAREVVDWLPGQLVLKNRITQVSADAPHS